MVELAPAATAALQSDLPRRQHHKQIRPKVLEGFDCASTSTLPNGCFSLQQRNEPPSMDTAVFGYVAIVKRIYGRYQQRQDMHLHPRGMEGLVLAATPARPHAHHSRPSRKQWYPIDTADSVTAPTAKRLNRLPMRPRHTSAHPTDKHRVGSSSIEVRPSVHCRPHQNTQTQSNRKVDAALAAIEGYPDAHLLLQHHRQCGSKYRAGFERAATSAHPDAPRQRQQHKLHSQMDKVGHGCAAIAAHAGGHPPPLQSTHWRPKGMPGALRVATQAHADTRRGQPHACFALSTEKVAATGSAAIANMLNSLPLHSSC